MVLLECVLDVRRRDEVEVVVELGDTEDDRFRFSSSRARIAKINTHAADLYSTLGTVLQVGCNQSLATVASTSSSRALFFPLPFKSSLFGYSPENKDSTTRSGLPPKFSDRSSVRTCEGRTSGMMARMDARATSSGERLGSGGVGERGRRTGGGGGGR